ncbi:MAG: helix-turn-helix transcriptional regulator [Gammaproteobacteria bacterium]|nr:helix-turn-helix transcriptional regulator [Gammaproteobacteria bacterium]
MTDQSTDLDPQALKAARQRRGMTQEQLAQRIECTKDTVSRWERGVAKVRPRFRNRLCDALSVAWSKLSKAPAESDEARDRLFGRVPIRASIRTHGRTALKLVALRYGIPEHQVLELAPLLFFVLAERSLMARSQRLSEIESAFEELDANVSKSLAHLGPVVMARSISADDALTNEEKSVRQRDVFGHLIDWPAQDEGPFVYFIRELTEDLPDGLEKLESYDGTTVDDYRFAGENLRQLVGEGTNATPDELVEQIWRGDLDLGECIGKKARLSEEDYHHWLDGASNEAAAESRRRWQEHLDLFIDSASSGEDQNEGQS